MAKKSRRSPAHDPRNPDHLRPDSQKKLQDALKWSNKQNAYKENGSGKGSDRRGQSAEELHRYEENYESIFGKKNLPHGR